MHELLDEVDVDPFFVGQMQTRFSLPSQTRRFLVSVISAVVVGLLLPAIYFGWQRA